MQYVKGLDNDYDGFFDVQGVKEKRRKRTFKRKECSEVNIHVPKEFTDALEEKYSTLFKLLGDE